MAESNTMQHSSSSAMYGKDGNLYMVPNSDVRAVMQDGGQMAVPMRTKTGDSIWVHAGDVSGVQRDGGRVDWSIVPQEHHEGFWGALGSDLLGMVKPDAKSVLYNAVAPGMAPTLAMVESTLKGEPKVLDQQRKAEGRSTPYRVAAQVAPAITGVNAPGMEQAAREGDTAGVLGHAAAPPVAMAATAGVAKAAPTIVRGMGRAALLGKTPEGAYQSALKPSTTLGEAKTNAIVQTGLQEGIPVSPAGLEKLSTLIDDLNQKIQATIQSDPNRPINKFSVTSRLSDTAKKFQTQVNPKSDMAAISDAGNEFLEAQPGAIRAENAQALKIGTYRQLKSKAYGELKGASIEAQKSLARGLKEELAQAFPELKELNARESQLLQLEPILEKAVSRIGNHQIAGIGTPITAAGAKAVTGSNAVAGTAAFIKAIVDNPNVKSRLAIAMSRKGSGVTVSQANARIAAYSAALGSGVGHSANIPPRDDQPTPPQPQP